MRSERDEVGVVNSGPFSVYRHVHGVLFGGQH